MNVSKGDAVTYVALVTSAVLQAAEPWRKEAATPPDLHPILSSPVWAYVPLALLTVVSLIWLFRQIRWPAPKRGPATSPPQEAPPQLSNPTGRSQSLYAPIVDMQIEGAKLNQAAPWLIFYCVGYNATGHTLQLASVSGRIKVGSEEFHGKLEFDRNPFMHPTDAFYRFSLRIPLTKPEADVCINVLSESPVYVEFIGCSVEGVANSSPANSMFAIPLPRQLKFDETPKLARLSIASP
jgi:hypothetical protein